MNKLSIEEKSERAHNKAFSKMIYIQKDIKRVQQEIREGGNGSVPVEMLQKSINHLQADLQTWEYIAKLIETDDYRQPIKSNVEMLHGMMGLADPRFLEVNDPEEL
tara:strand:+ start:354 stop:671 length:318 start_codon:yes stop_codon:yes gene_type:complete